MKLIRNKLGFTMTEILVTLAIIAIIASFAIPSLIGYIEHGNQVRRTNIARTIYVAAQTRLTEYKATDSLRDLLTNYYYDDDETDEPDGNNKVWDELTSANFPAADADNQEYVRYISKPAGVYNDSWPQEIKDFYNLLDEAVIDKTILNGAILMEYNIKTGVIMSVFYSDVLEDGVRFEYLGDADNARNNVFGKRSEAYQYALERKQGYYGVETTGDLPFIMQQDTVNIYDGYEGYDGTIKRQPLTSGDVNTLYADILLPVQADARGNQVEMSYVFSIVNANNHDTVLFETQPINLGGLPRSTPKNLSEALADASGSKSFGGDIIYEEYDAATDGLFKRFIWVIDYAGGDMLTSAPHSIVLKYQDEHSADLTPQNVRAKVERTDATATDAADINKTSLTIANTHYLYAFEDDGGEKYATASARHLHNVRHAPDAHFRQIDNIDMTGVTNFRPIEGFTGSYVGAKDEDGAFYNISKLTINVNVESVSQELDGIGLFADCTGGEKDTPGIQDVPGIQGISLVEPKITAPYGGNVGAAVGLLNAAAVKDLSSAEAKITSEVSANAGGLVGLMQSAVIDGKTIDSAVESSSSYKANITSGNDANVGGLAGLMKSGLIDGSYAYSRITAAGGNTGGLVGHIEAGTLSRSYNAGFYNATVTPASASETGFGFLNAGKGDIGGLVGKNDGTVQSCFNNARVNVTTVTVRNAISSEPQAFRLTGDANLGGIAGSSSGTVESTYATNYIGFNLIRDGLYIKSYGGIIGVNTGSADNNFFISNGSTASNVGNEQKQVRKSELRSTDSPEVINALNDDSNAFVRSGRNAASNRYLDYPYPVLRDNLATGDHWGWEDIEGVEGVSAQLVYYEKYDDGTYGYSNREDPDPQVLATNGSKLLVNEGYAVEFTHAQEITFIVGGKSYALRDNRNNPQNPDWSWVGGTAADIQHLPVRITAPGDIDEVFRLYIENSVLESLASGDDFISFRVNVFGNTILDTTFNPLFADSVDQTDRRWLYVRSGRHLDNVDKALDTDFIQSFSIDFEVYRKELQRIPQTATEASIITTGDKMVFDSAIVTGSFGGEYDGKYCYIKHAKAQKGIFDTVGTGAVVKNFALLASEFTGSGAVGSVASINSGTVEYCEVSNVTVMSESGGTTVGGVVGYNYGGATIQNVYFNSTHRDDGVYASPVSGGHTATGGLVGRNFGTLANAYTTALAPEMNGLHYPTVGIPAGGSSGTLENVYYLVLSDYNASEFISPGQGTPRLQDELGSVFSGNNSWEQATVGTTVEHSFGELAYPFPKLKFINHYYDWPIMQVLFKYYERYGDGSYGYFYYVDENSLIDTLRYESSSTVIEEGYMIDVNSTNRYWVHFGESNPNTGSLTQRRSVVVDNRRAVKLLHNDVESLITSANANGVTPVRIRASAVNGTSSFVDELSGSIDGINTYFNPRFAKAIYLDETNPGAQNGLEVRSPRHMININTSSGFTALDYVQTISLNFAMEDTLSHEGRTVTRRIYSYDQEYDEEDEIDDRTPIEDHQLSSNRYLFPDRRIGRNIISGFTGTYDGKDVKNRKDSATGRPVSNRIYNLVLNVSDASTNIATNNTGSAFGDLGTINNASTNRNARIENLEFVDAQIRYDGNGMGGGIVVNNCFGTVENVNVRNEIFRRSLFANANGSTNTNFCASRPATEANMTTSNMIILSVGSNRRLECGHAHGAIAATVFGEHAKITACISGTNSSNIEEVTDNKTIINCRPSSVAAPSGSAGDRSFIHVGGIAGSVSAQAKVISCANMTKIQPLTVGTQSTCVGGITGLVGYIMAQGGSNQDVNSRGFIIGSYNAGTVIFGNSYVGGITGRSAGGATNDNYMTQIISCYNTGRVNVYEGTNGQLQTHPYAGNSALRLGGISGETNGTRYNNCYNVGYISNSTGTGTSDATGAILGLPWDSRSIVENCFSLKADRWAPATIVGPKYYQNGNINGIANASTFDQVFGSFWETRLKLSGNKVLINPVYGTETYPGLTFTPGAAKSYPVFGKKEDSFYLYPQFLGGSFSGVACPANPHVAPWEYIDSQYDATLKYYEQYEDNSYGYYFLTRLGVPENTLKTAVVKEDGYIIETGMRTNYKVVINTSHEFTKTAAPVAGKYNGRTVIELDAAMRAQLQTGYNKIQAFTIGLVGEDDELNRIIGATSTYGATDAGGPVKDLFFDYNFPRESMYATQLPSMPPPAAEANHIYYIRSPRHIDSISKMTAHADGNLTEEKIFMQELDVDFDLYNFASYDVQGYSGGAFTRPVAQGEFLGNYNGMFKTIRNVKINGGASNGSIGLFETNKGTVQRFKLDKPVYTSASTGDLNMGLIAAKNEFAIQLIAVTDPTLSGTSAAVSQSIGGIVGTNAPNAPISHVYLVSRENEPTPPITTTGAGVNKLGGIAGVNAGKMDFVIYLAKAEENKINPISGENTGEITANALYLRGTGYNDFNVGTTGGISKTMMQFDELIEDPNDWAGWAPNWGRVQNYPYPSLRSIDPPADFPKPLSTFSVATSGTTMYDEFAEEEEDVELPDEGAESETPEVPAENGEPDASTPEDTEAPPPDEDEESAESEPPPDENAGPPDEDNNPLKPEPPPNEYAGPPEEELPEHEPPDGEDGETD